jgi:hypothetical protein
LLLAVIFVVKDGILFLWLFSFWFVEGLLFAFSRVDFRPCIGFFFLLLSFEGLDSWKVIM